MIHSRVPLPGRRVMGTAIFDIEALDQPAFTHVGHGSACQSHLSLTARHPYMVPATFVNQGSVQMATLNTATMGSLRGWETFLRVC